MPVRSDAVTIRRELGGGAFGVVFEVDTPAGLITDPVCAYKQFKPAQLSRPELDNIDVLITYRNGLSPPDRDFLDSATTWPLDTVTDSAGSVVGYLMRLVPQTFIEPAITQVGSDTTPEPRTLGWLIDPVTATGVNVADVIDAGDLQARLRYSAWIARIFNFLHRHHVVYGDLSEKNVLYRKNAAVPVVLVDTDPARVRSVSPDFTQAHSPNMIPPENRGANPTKAQDEYTDRYKLAVLLYHVLGCTRTIDKNLSAVYGKIDRDGIDLFGRGMGRDRANRPSADDWYRYLYDRFSALASPPQIRAFAVNPDVGVLGQAVTVRWEVAGHESLTLVMPSGHQIDIGISGADFMHVSLQQSGQFRLIARNRTYTAEVFSDIVHVFSPPRIDFVTVPEFGQLFSMMPPVDLTALRGAVHNIKVQDELRSLLVVAAASPQLPSVLGDANLLTPNFVGAIFSKDIVDVVTEAVDARLQDI